MENFVALEPAVCWFGNLLSDGHLHEIALALRAEKRHEHFLYPYTEHGAAGFNPLETVEQQAFCQHLAHLGCIPAMLLFGYSLSPAYISTPRVICPAASTEYLLAGISAFLIHHRDPGFEQEFAYFWGNFWFDEICRYLLKWLRINTPDDVDHPVRQFCEWWVVSLAHPHLDS